jgi:hypothetical protein
MGEIIQKITTISIGDSEFDIEINHPSYDGGEREIHIQNKKIRLSVPESDFLQMAACLLLARKQFDRIKGVEEERGHVH